MHRHPLAYLLAVVLVALAATFVRAAERCTMSCRAEVAACRRSECGSARGADRRECIEKRCRGPLGCPARIRTLAYVVTGCRTRGGRLVGWQELRIRRGDCDSVTVLRFEPHREQDDPAGLCGLVASNRAGFGSVLAGVFQRLGVTPDGSGVVFEVTNQFQLIGKTPLADEQQGFFYVRADGSGLRRLGPPSGDRSFRIVFEPTGEPVGIFQTYLPFSPRGRLVAYPDVGPAPDGTEVTQIFMLDVTTGQRTQVTRLLPLKILPSDFSQFSVTGQVFRDEQTIQWLRPSEKELYTIRTDGSGLQAAPLLPEAVKATPAPQVFSVAQSIGRIVDLALPGTPRNLIQSQYPDLPVVEVFRILEGRNLLQLTSFGRFDTHSVSSRGWGGNGFVDRGRVLLVASADRFGENPFENCQLLSIDSWGGELRQLRHFDEGAPSVNGCAFGSPPGCAFADVYQDPVTHWIVFYSNCDPFHVGFNGSQVFAMRPDGRRLRQLTHTAGTRWIGDEVEVEIPGPIAYSMPIR